MFNRISTKESDDEGGNRKSLGQCDANPTYCSIVFCKGEKGNMIYIVSFIGSASKIGTPDADVVLFWRPVIAETVS